MENKRGPAGNHPCNLRQAMARFERGYLSNILELTQWDRAKAAKRGKNNEIKDSIGCLGMRSLSVISRQWRFQSAPRPNLNPINAIAVKPVFGISFWPLRANNVLTDINNF